MDNALKWRLGSEERDYAKAGVKKGNIELWEDAARAPMGKGTFEWWYFDSKYPDGTAISFVFYTKELANVYEDIDPYVDVRVTLPDGKEFVGRHFPGEKGFKYSKEKPYMVCGDCWFLSDMKTTMIHLDAEGIICDLRFDGVTPSYRMHNGFWYFDENDKWYLGWINGHPKAMVSGTLICNGQKYVLSDGLGYRDHNWGNYAWSELLSHWIWTKVYAGDYMLAPAVLVSTENTGFTRIPNYQVLKGNDVLFLDFVGNSDVRSIESSIHPKTGLRVPDKVVSTYKNGDDEINITFVRRRDLKIFDNVEVLPEPKKAMARKMGVASWYYRFDASCVVDLRLNGIKEHYEVDGLYEYQQLSKGVE